MFSVKQGRAIGLSLGRIMNRRVPLPIGHLLLMARMNSYLQFISEDTQPTGETSGGYVGYWQAGPGRWSIASAEYAQIIELGHLRGWAFQRKREPFLPNNRVEGGGSIKEWSKSNIRVSSNVCISGVLREI